MNEITLQRGCCRERRSSKNADLNLSNYVITKIEIRKEESPLSSSFFFLSKVWCD